MSNSSTHNIQLKNVFYMMAYALKAINLDAFKKVDAEKFDRPDNLLGTILHEALRPLILSGLFKAYIPTSDDITTIKGRLCVSPTIRNRAQRKQRIHCEFDEFSSNNLFNKIIRVALEILVKSSQIGSHLRKKLKQDLIAFAVVDSIAPTSINWSTLRYQRNNVNYRVIMNFCRLIIDSSLMGDKDESGKIKLKLFTEKTLHDIYEAFLREYYRIHHPEVCVLGKKQLRWDVPDEDQDKMPKMETDVMLRVGNKVLIIDAKYYGSILGSKFGSTGGYNNANLYQIRTYVESAVADPEYRECWVSGLLLYAKTDEKVSPLRTSMQGNSIGISVLDLNLDFDRIRDQLDALIQEYFPA